MKRNDAEQIGKLIQQYLRQESLESPLNEQRLLDAWPQVLGPAASYTSNLYIRNQTLYVHLTSAALRQELMMGRELLVRTLNQRVGATVITNIISRQPEKNRLSLSSPAFGASHLPGHSRTEFPDIGCCGHPLR